MNWFPKQRIVVPIDFSEESFSALETALQLVEDASHIHVVHVLQDMSANEPGVVWGVVDKESRTRHVMEALTEELSDTKHAGLELHVMFGDAGYEISAYAKDVGADLIVMPSHGRTGLKRMMIGSVAERVVRLAHCPVLVLRS